MNKVKPQSLHEQVQMELDSNEENDGNIQERTFDGSENTMKRVSNDMISSQAIRAVETVSVEPDEQACHPKANLSATHLFDTRRAFEEKASIQLQFEENNDKAGKMMKIEEENAILQKAIYTQVSEADKMLRSVSPESNDQSLLHYNLQLKKNELRRCSSSVLIPSHGANRCLPRLKHCNQSNHSDNCFYRTTTGDPSSTSSCMDFEYQPTNQKQVSHTMDNTIERLSDDNHFSSLQNVENRDGTEEFMNEVHALEVPEKKFISHYKSKYKSCPLFREYRKSKSNQRISILRSSTLAKRRSYPAKSSVDLKSGNSKSDQVKYIGYGKKKFFEKAMAESERRVQIQKALRCGIYDIPSKEMNLTLNKDQDLHKENKNSVNLLDGENDSKATERQRERHKQFKALTFQGTIREKSKEIAKRFACFQRNKIIESRRAGSQE